MINFLKNNFAEIIAFLALLQPWGISLYRKYMRKGHIEVYETGKIEVGYSAFGATLGVNGTLRCINNDLFIRKMQVELVRLKDSATHKLDWGIFRSEKVTLKGENEGSFELPYGFMLTSNLPFRFNIQFHDMQMQDEIRAITNEISEEWGKRRAALIQSAYLDELSNLQNPLLGQDPYWQLYEKYKKSEVYVNAYTKLNQHCYFDAGLYSLKIRIYASQPDESFEYKWTFNLNDDDARVLRLNVLNILDDACGRRQNLAPYFFAYANFQK